MQNGLDIIEASWQRQLDEHPFWKAWAVSAPQSHDVVIETLRAPGKRMRPMLFGLACRAAGRDPFPDWLPVALSLELVHNFILVHDDLMDRSEIRRGVPTLPRRMEQLMADAAGRFCGADVALVTGDLLYTMAMESLLRAKAPPEQITAAMREFMSAAMDTGRGALLEIRAARSPLADLRPEAIEPIYNLKTGRYSFALPMQLAALFCDIRDWMPFAQFAQHAGMAYQLRNDRESLHSWLEGGPLPDDLRDGRRTWAMVRAWHEAAPAGRAVLEAPPGDNLRNVLREIRILDILRDTIRHRAGQALDLLPTCSDLHDFLAATLAD